MKETLKKYIVPIIIILVLIIAALITTSCRKSASGIKLKNPDNESVIFPILSFDNNSILYFSQAKKSLKIWDLKKNKTEDLIELNFDQIDDIEYSPNQEQALIHWSNPKNSFDAHTWLANLKDKKLENELSTNILNAVWSPDGTKIAYHFFDWDNNINNLAISNPDGSGWETLTNIQQEAIVIAWIDNTTVIFYTIPFELATVDVNLINLESKAVSKIIDQKIVGQAKVLKEQNKILFDIADSETSDFKLNIYDIQNKKLNPTDSLVSVNNSVQKESSAIIYGVFRPADARKDKLVEVDSNNNSLKELDTSLNQSIKTQGLLISPDGKTLFLNSEGVLYRLNL